MSSNLISTPLDECQSWWASTLRAMRPWRHNLCTLRLVRRKTIDLVSTTSLESQESYLTTGMLPYKHSSFFPPALSHGSIMLLPRQPRIFARLARWQSWKLQFPRLLLIDWLQCMSWMTISSPTILENLQINKLKCKGFHTIVRVLDANTCRAKY